MTVKELFSDWIEPDIAECYLACLLGIMEYDSNLDGTFWTVSGVFHTINKVGSMLFDMLENMVKGGILEKNEEYQYRWNNTFKGYWEGGKAGLTTYNNL